MIRNLTKIGADLGIIIEKPILELLNIDTSTPLEVRTDGTGLIIRPVADGAEADSQAPRPAAPTPPPASAPPPPPPAAAPVHDEDDLFEDDSDEDEPAPPPPPSPPPPPAARSAPLDDEPASAEAPPPPPPPVPAPAVADPSSEEAPDADDRPLEIVVTLRGEEHARLAFDQPKMVLGRESNADIHLADKALSRKHAMIEMRGAAVWVSDLGSANGTYLNGAKLEEPTRLDAGDVIGVGHFRVTIEGGSAPSESTPVLTLDGPHGQHRFMMVGEKIIVGRHQTCDICIGHKSISRRHMQITMDGDGFIVEDLGSQNGVTLREEKIAGPTRVEPGELLKICEFTLSLDFVDEQGGGAGQPMVDKGGDAKAAYLEGDFENVRSSAGIDKISENEPSGATERRPKIVKNKRKRR